MKNLSEIDQSKAFITQPFGVLGFVYFQELTPEGEYDEAATNEVYLNYLAQ